MFTSPLNGAEIRKDFPIFSKTMRGGGRLVYLDSGATSQKPNSVLAGERYFYENHNAAVHRGSHLLAEEANEAYEGARAIVAHFLGANLDEIIFTKSATEGLNLLAYSFGNSASTSRFALNPGDRIVLSEMEHHANLIPWQQLAKRCGAEIVWFPVDPDGRLDLSAMNDIISERTKIVALTHQSNVLGTINPLDQLISRTHEVGAVFVLDACQSAPHFAIDVKSLGPDFLVFSGHKALGPTGIGVLWGRAELLEEMEPFLTGGSMIESVTMTDATWASAPRKFEAGVPNMAGAVGLGIALQYLLNVGMNNVEAHEHALTQYALTKFADLERVRIIGPTDTKMRGSVLSFEIDGVHPHDAGQVLDQHGIAVRTGHHCAWPLMRKLGIVGTTRASFYIYNDEKDVDALIDGILATQKYFKV
ncbi:MAG: SufS family cysteine desulfurase [Actinobacteria bacterium]|uniref:cysteine desulfurase n=1 Tax=freshwater metagenome TaxID=449393 RepID=A0A6J6G5G4_9ZZZZ|nr:SufS family cysteine desulfurase [Actinomycetota bacterium]